VLNDLSKQVAHCYRRAAECKELAALAGSRIDRQSYLDREQAWLVLARSYESSERLGQMINEMERQQRRGVSPTRNVSTSPKLPTCPACNIEMLFQGSHPRMFVQPTTSVGRGYFLCPNCRRLTEQLMAMPAD
jgi:hypothetical protein